MHDAIKAAIFINIYMVSICFDFPKPHLQRFRFAAGFVWLFKTNHFEKGQFIAHTCQCVDILSIRVNNCQYDVHCHISCAKVSILMGVADVRKIVNTCIYNTYIHVYTTCIYMYICI